MSMNIVRLVTGCGEKLAIRNLSKYKDGYKFDIVDIYTQKCPECENILKNCKPIKILINSNYRCKGVIITMENYDEYEKIVENEKGSDKKFYDFEKKLATDGFYNPNGKYAKISGTILYN